MEEYNICTLEHPRSGANYISHLISENFFNEPYINKKVGTHKLIKLSPSIKYIYMYRNSIDVLKSIFKMKEMFSLDVKNFDTFCTTKYSEMHFLYLEKDVILVRNNKIELVHENRNNVFRGINMIPIEYHTKHIAYYDLLSDTNDNILPVSYDALLLNMDLIMPSIANFLGRKCPKSFINIEKRVGWNLPEESIIWNK